MKYYLLYKSIMIESNSKFKVRKSSEKNFGIVFSFFFLILAIYPLLHNQKLNLYFLFCSLFCSLFFLILALFFSKLLKYPNYLWFKLGNILGHIVSPVIMLLIYIVVFLPTGIYFRILRRDSLNLKIDKQKETYWVVRKPDNNSMKNQF